jgi:hypothetical protein
VAAEAGSELAADPSAALERDLKHSFVGLTEYVGRLAFGRLIDDLYELPLDERPRFVDEVVLEPEQRQRRGIVEPDGIVVQRSTFADGRPTLFCVSKKLPPGHGWHKITVTFDNDGMALGG